MKTVSVEVSVKGKVTKVPATLADGHTLLVNGRGLRIATIFDEDWQLNNVEDPDALVASLKQQSSKVDLFTFAQKLPDTKPRFNYPLVWDNVAAIPITSYSAWWDKLPQATRRNVRLAARKNLVVRQVSFDDDLIRGIKGIYDESPSRQGKRFWHYGKNLETVKRENGTYVDRSDFIGAFLDVELVGFIKMVRVGKVSSIMQILSKNKHFDKRPTNALIAKAVEVSAAQGMTHFVYCQYVYGNNADSPLTEFKRRNGFEQILLPRYYIPLTSKGKMALKLNLHLGLRRLLPKRLDSALLDLRARLYDRIAGKSAGGETE